ncbi:hypothetical protein NL108_014174 [Boleophthalmus pectinirostris]|nr:hypothetical protein NL108_014174 [Boleophthalmus pectinirostris]
MMAFPPQEALSGPVSEEDLVALSCSVCGRERSQTLFCVSDLQPVCVECGDSEDHEDHRFRPIVEAAQELRQELDQSLLPLKEELEKAKDFQEMLLVIADCVKKQSHQTKRQIQDQFNKMHQFLEEEEEARLKALTEEDEQKIQKMKDKMDGCEQRDRSSVRNHQSLRGAAESRRRLLPAPVQGCSGESAALPPAGGTAAGPRSSDRPGQTSGQLGLQRLEQHEDDGALLSCHNGSKQIHQ